MAEKVTVTEIYWEEADADAEADAESEDQNESQNYKNESQNESETEEIEMKVYEDVGNRAEAQACLENKKEEKSEYLCKFNVKIERQSETE
jgi:hypothetical protein